MNKELLLLGIDGGGTRCRARLCSFSGATLGEGFSGPANIRSGLEESLTAVLDATSKCAADAGLSLGDHTVVACLALAGASESSSFAALSHYEYPFRATVFTTDAHAACVGAHAGQDGGVVIIGTGSVGHGVVEGKHHRVGGWGFPVSDEGSGAWLGCELVRRALWAHDGRSQWTKLLSEMSRKFESDPLAIVRWMSSAKPGDFGVLAPLVIEHALRGDPVGCGLMKQAASYIDGLAERLNSLGVHPLALSGGLAPSIESWLSPMTRSFLVPAAADALTGAVALARAAALTGAVDEKP